MGLLSLFQRDATAPAGRRSAAGDAGAASIEQLRTRARRRLIGSAILVLAAVLAFSFLLETQPRREGRSVAIEVIDKDDASTIVSGRVKSKAADVPAGGPAKAAPGAEVITETAAEVARDRPVPPAAVTAPQPRNDVKATAPAETAILKSADKVEDKAGAKAAIQPAAAEGDRALALLEGREAATRSAAAVRDAQAPSKANAAQAEGAAAIGAGRYVVQVGAFADVQAARAVRLRVEKLGLKTYTQVVQTADGQRIRVRVGPFSSRAEADKVLDKIKSDGLKPAVLTL
jgi:DedD protein